MRARAILLLLPFLGSCVSDSVANPDGGGPMTDVAGKVLDEFGNPVPNAKIGVAANITTSGADGSFHILATATYDLVVVNDNGTTSTGKRIAAWLGLTTRTPSLQVWTQPPRRSALITIANNARPVMPNDRVAFLFTSPQASPIVGALPTGQGNGLLGGKALEWGGAATVSGSAYAIQYQPPGMNGVFPTPTMFLGGDIQMFTGLTDKAMFTAGTWSFVNSPPPNQVNLTIAYGGTTGVKMQVLYRPDAYGAFVFDDDMFKGETTRSFLIPNAATPYKGGAVVVANTASGGVALGWKVGIAPNTNPLNPVSASITIGAADLVPTSPTDGATVDKPATMFTYPAIPNAAYRNLFLCPGDNTGLQTAVDILTSQTSFKIPETSALGATLANTPCKWTVMAVPTAKTTDDLAGAAGWQTLVDPYRATTDSWNIAAKARTITIK